MVRRNASVDVEPSRAPVVPPAESAKFRIQRYTFNIKLDRDFRRADFEDALALVKIRQDGSDDTWDHTSSFSEADFRLGAVQNGKGESLRSERQSLEGKTRYRIYLEPQVSPGEEYLLRVAYTQPVESALVDQGWFYRRHLVTFGETFGNQCDSLVIAVTFSEPRSRVRLLSSLPAFAADGANGQTSFRYKASHLHPNEYIGVSLLFHAGWLQQEVSRRLAWIVTVAAGAVAGAVFDDVYESLKRMFGGT